MAISSARHLRRQQNLKLLVEEMKSASTLAVVLDTPKSHISALLSGTRGIGDKLAHKMEGVMGKPAGWMDEDHSEVEPTPVDPKLIAGLSDLRRINPETYDRLAREIMTIVEGARASDRVIRAKTAADYVTPERAREVFERQIEETRAQKKMTPEQEAAEKETYAEIVAKAQELQTLVDRINASHKKALGNVIIEQPIAIDKLLSTPSGFGELRPDVPAPPAPKRK